MIRKFGIVGVLGEHCAMSGVIAHNITVVLAARSAWILIVRKLELSQPHVSMKF